MPSGGGLLICLADDRRAQHSGNLADDRRGQHSGNLAGARGVGEFCLQPG